MPYQLTDINIIRNDLEMKLGKEELEKAQAEQAEEQVLEEEAEVQNEV